MNKKNLNWITEFIETQQRKKATLRINKEYLKHHLIFHNLKTLSYQIEETQKNISIQKGRITRQTNEQNNELILFNKKIVGFERRLKKLEDFVGDIL